MHRMASAKSPITARCPAEVEHVDRFNSVRLAGIPDRRLRCLVVVDLKLGKLTHADAGQMHMYLNYAKEHWTVEGENPPVGLIMCAEKDNAVAHYAIEGLPNKVMAAEYQTVLPNEQILIAEIRKAMRMVETRKAAIPGRKQARKKG